MLMLENKIKFISNSHSKYCSQAVAVTYVKHANFIEFVQVNLDSLHLF